MFLKLFDIIKLEVDISTELQRQNWENAHQHSLVLPFLLFEFIRNDLFKILDEADFLGNFNALIELLDKGSFAIHDIMDRSSEFYFGGSMLVMIGKKIGNFCRDFLNIIFSAFISWKEYGYANDEGVSLSLEFNIKIVLKSFIIL